MNYAYDSKGGVKTITVNPVNANGIGFSASQSTLLSTVTYNIDGNVSGWKWSDSKARSIGYDEVGNITSYTLGDPTGSGNATGVTRTVTRDNAGRIGAYTHSGTGAMQGALDQVFGYDDLNRLTSQTANATSYGYTYDATGNRKTKTIGAATYTNTVAANSNRYTQTQDVGGSATIVHDDAGHITSDGTNTFTYNDRGRMTSATTPGGVISFKYNGLEQRASKTGAAATYYVYDEAGQLLGEYDANGRPVHETVYLGSTPVGVMKQTGTAGAGDVAVALYNVHADQIDTPRVITRQDHTIVWRWDTAEAFGATAPSQDPSGLGAFAFSQRFPGQVFDSETGLAQNWNREYNARTGRYVQSDPVGLNGGINPYAYAGGRPVSATDKTGLLYWTGGMHARSASAPIGGGWIEFDLTSPCKNGVQAKIQVVAVGPAAGVGLAISESYGDIAFEDHQGDITPTSFNGLFMSVGAGVTVGKRSTTLGLMRLGNAYQAPEIGGSTGLDVGATILIGSSTVTKVEIKDCQCK